MSDTARHWGHKKVKRVPGLSCRACPIFQAKGKACVEMTTSVNLSVLLGYLRAQGRFKRKSVLACFSRGCGLIGKAEINTPGAGKGYFSGNRGSKTLKMGRSV